MCKGGLHNCFNPKTCVYKGYSNVMRFMLNSNKIGPALFSCVCADGYQSINQKCIERCACVCVCAFQSVPRYDEYRSSVTVSDLRLRDILSGLDTRQFTVPDGADFHLFKVNIYVFKLLIQHSCLCRVLNHLVGTCCTYLMETLVLS